jgi:hypothetical protein
LLVLLADDLDVAGDAPDLIAVYRVKGSHGLRSGFDVRALRVA